MPFHAIYISQTLHSIPDIHCAPSKGQKELSFLGEIKDSKHYFDSFQPLRMNVSSKVADHKSK